MRSLLHFNCNNQLFVAYYQGKKRACAIALFSVVLTLVSFWSYGQSMLTTPTSLYNYQTDVSVNKDGCVAISEDGNVSVKGSPFANNSKGAVSVYFRDNSGVWSSMQLAFPADYKASFFSFLIEPIKAANNNFGGPSRKNLLGNINSAFGAANAGINAGITGINNVASAINGVTPNDDINFGSSVAISADASTLVIGAKNTNNGVGAFWIYKRDSANPKNYKQFGSIMYPLDYNGKSAIGSSVAVSGDGSRIIVGGPNDDLKVSIFESCDGTMNVPLIDQTITLPFSSGRVPIWLVSKTIDYLFEQLVAKITKVTDDLGPVLGPPAGYIIEQFFERVVKPPVYAWMNDQLHIETEEYKRQKVGAAWVFKLSSDGKSYEQEGDKLQNKGRDGLLPPIVLEQSNLGPAQTTLDSINGSQTSINSVLTRVNQITTAMDPLNDLFSFAGVKPFPSVDIPPFVGTRDVYVTPDANSPYYNELLALKNATNSRAWANAYQGASVSISKDGLSVMMGAPGLLSGKGVSYIYKYGSNVWNGEDVLAGDTSGGLSPLAFGNCVAISQDGLNAVVGAPASTKGTDTMGTALVFKKNTSSNRWSKTGNNIVPNNSTLGSNKRLDIGASVSISSDNDDVIIGAPYDNNGKGAFWLYKPISNVWTNQQKITPSISNGNFGRTVAIGEYGLTLVVGAPNTSSGGNAYVYNSCEPPKPILAQYADSICSGYQFNNYYQNNKRLNSATGWVWRMGSETGSVFVPGTGESANNDGLVKKTFSGTTTFYVRGEGGCVNGKSASITTVVKPTPSITSVTPNYVCNGGQITLNATANSGKVQWIGSTWDGLRYSSYGFYDSYENNPNYTAPYNYYARDADPKKIAYGIGTILATGNTYKPTINNSRNFYVSSMLNGCWSDTASVNARIERIVDIAIVGTGSRTMQICDSPRLTYPLTIDAWSYDDYRDWQKATPFPEKKAIPTQLPFTYKYYIDSAGMNLLESSSQNQKTVDMGGYVSSGDLIKDRNSQYKYYYYTITNTCGTSAPYQIIAKRDPGPAMSHLFIKADSQYICPGTQANLTLQNTRSSELWNYSFRIYDSSAGNNLVDTILPNWESYWDFSTGTSVYKQRFAANYKTPTLNASKNYYINVYNACGESRFRTPVYVKVDALNLPQIYGINATPVCDSGQVLLSAQANDGSIKWYTSPDPNATPLTPNTLYEGQYLTPKLTTSRTYYVGSTGQKCFGAPRIPITATVYETPTLTVSKTSYTSCIPGADIYLSATASIGAVYWYDSPTSDIPIWTQPTFRVYPGVTTTYYVEALTSSSCKSARVPVTVYINQPPVITQVVNGSRVNAGTVNLSATADYGTVNWTATDGTLLGLGNNYTTWSLNTTTTYYASASTADTGCISAVRVPVVATINFVPIVNTTMNASRCGAGPVTLSASAEVGTIRWYDANNNQVGTGNSFTTPSLNATTTYYAQSWYLNSNSQYVQSAMVPVKAYIYTINTPTISYSGGCVGQQPRVNISSLQNGVRYSLRNGTTVLDSKIPNGINNNFDLVAPPINTATTYNVFAEKFDSSTALRFDGDNDYVEVLNHAGLNPFSQLMLGAWVKKETTQKTQVIISKNNTSANTGYELSISSDDKLTLDIGIQRFQTTATISNAWTHVAASVNDNGIIKLYINGVESASFSRSGQLPTNNGNLIIGSSQQYKGDANYGFSGAIDEVAVFCGVNFNTSIADMMNGKLVGNEYGLIAYYNFEHGANITNIVDGCSNAGANNGVLNNMDSVNAWVNGPGIVYCSSQLSSSTITPVTVPSIVNSISPSRVGPGPVTLNAVASAGATTKWYSDSSLTTNVATGNNYNIPLLGYTTKFFAVANNGCNSPKVTVTATINDYPDEQQINCISSANDVNIFDNVSAASFTSMVRAGQYLFVGTGYGEIKVYTAGGGSLTFVSTLQLPLGAGDVYRMVIANGYLYASQRSHNKLYVIDYADVSNLKVLGISNSYFNAPTSFAVDANYAYVSSRDDQSLYVAYIGQPSVNILNVGSVALGEAAYCVQKKDNIVYIGVNNVGIRVVDVSSPFAPYINRTLTFTGGSYNDFYIKGNYLYVSPAMVAATPYNTVLKVYDISNASNPVFVRDVTLNDGYAVSYTADSKYLYLGTYSQQTGTRRLQILDIATPSNPTLISSKTVNNADAIAVRLGHIYMQGYAIDDYTIPTAAGITSTQPAFRYGAGTVKLSATATGGTINWYAAASGGSSLGTGANFTTPSISATTTFYVGAVDGNCISARTAVTATVVDVPPCITSSSDLGSPSSTNTGIDVKCMYRSGNYVYFIGESWIYVYNISSGSPVLTSTFNVGGAGMILDIKVVNNYLYAVARGSEKLFIIDISNPASLQNIGSTSSIFNIPQGLWVEGNFAYVNNGDNHSLDIINIANPSSPSRVGQLTGLGDPAKGIQKKGNYIYLANWAYGFTVVDVSNPTAPALVQHINSKESGDPAGAYNLYIIGNYLYVASDQGSSNPRMKIYDLSNPTNPTLVNSITPPYNVLSFDYDGIYLYCGLRKFTTSGNNVAVYKMSNLTSPTLVGTTNTGSQTSVVGIAATSIAGNGRIFAASTSFPGFDLVTFPVNNTVTITSVTANSRCGTGSVNLQATASAGTINWYTDSAATSLAGTGASFNTPSISVPTIYYVTAANGGCSLPTIPVLATVNTVPVITNTVAATRRDTGTVDLQATANTGLLKWYNVASGGSVLDYGSLFTTPIINNTTTFYVESQGTLCTSTRVPVVATVITTPVIRTTTDGSRCLPGVDTLYATASIGTINWYDNNLSTTPLATGNMFITPSLTSSRYYMVSATNNGETSARIQVAAHIGKSPASANAGADINNFCGNSVTLHAAAINGFFGQWYVNNGVANIDTAYSLNPTISGIGGSVQLLWKVSSPYCPDNVDTVNINVAKPKPILYGVGYGCQVSVNNLAKYDANKDSVTFLKELWGTPDINNIYGAMVVASNGKMYGLSEQAGANNKGAIFEFDPRTQVLKVIYSFTQSDGYNPRPPLVETSPGVFWGTAANGGANGRGVVYKFNVNSGQYTVVRSSPSTGDSYRSGLVVKGSKVYLISRDANQLHEIDTAANAFVVKYTFPASASQTYSAANFILGRDGNLYGSNIPNNCCGQMFKFDFTTNTHSIVYTNPTDNSFGANFSADLFLASNNKIYWVGENGGANGNGTIMEFDPATNTASKKFDFSSSQNVRGSNGCTFIQASDGYLYSSSSGGGAFNNGGLFRFNPTTGTFQLLKAFPACSATSRPINSNLVEYTTSGANAGVDSTICGNTYSLTALGASYGTGTWTVVKGSATIANVNNANSSVTLSTDTAILRWTVTDGLCFTSADEVQIIRKALPVITASGLQSCTAVNGNYTLTATSAGATLNWYADSTGTSVLATGSTYTIASSNSSAKVFVTATANGCTSLRVPVALSLPLITSTTPGVRCSAGSVTLQAVANTGTINWYAAATGGTSLGTGNSFATPTITGTATYYAEASQNGCSSARVAVTASITGDFNANVWPVKYSFSSIYGNQADVSLCPNSASKIYTTSLADNDLNTGAGTVNYTGESWIQAKFAAPSTVTSVIVAGGYTCSWNVGSGDLVTYLNGCLLQYSNDGVNWTTHSTISGTSNTATTTINVGSITAQYWRLYKNGNNYVSAGEFSFSPMPSATSPLMANAGPDQTSCASTFTISGNTPTQGTGVWSVERGTATITNPTNPTTTVTGVKGTAILRWTFNSTSCGISFDEVMLTANVKPILWGVTDNYIYNYNTSNNTISSQLQNNAGNNSLFKGSNNKMYLFTNTTSAAGFYGTLFEYLPNKATANSIRPRYNSGGYFEDNAVIYSTGTFQHYSYNISTGVYGQIQALYAALPGTNAQDLGPAIKIGNTIFGTALHQNGGYYFIYSFNLLTSQATIRYSFPSNAAGKGTLILGTNGKLYGINRNGGTSGYGSIYEFDTTTNTLTTKINFANYNSMNSASDFLFASNNKLYGTCQNGGGNNAGSFWEYDYLNNSFSVRANFQNTSTTGANPNSGFSLMQASDGKIYGATQNGGANSRGMIYSFDPTTNSFNYLQSINVGNENSYSGRLVEYNDLIADAGPDQNICSSTATMAANTAFAGTGTWSVVAGTATITSVSSPTTTVTNLKGTTILRWTLNNGLCASSTSYDDVVINAAPAIDAVTNGSRCGTGAGIVTLGATAKQGTINWYATATGGTSLGTGSSFTTPSISTTTTYYVDVTFNGCTSTTRTAVVAYIASALATPTITAGGSTTICNGTSVGLTATTSSSYLWLPNGETTQSITVTTAGTYSVTITNSSGCSATSAITTVTVNASGVVANAGSDQVNCSGSFTMAGNGTGTWTVVSGSAIITTANSATTAVMVRSGAATLRWTTTTSCGTTTDDVVLTKTSSSPLLIFPTVNEPNCTSCGVGSYNLFDVTKAEIVSKKVLINNDVYYQEFLYKASDGTLYGLARSGGNEVFLFYFNPVTNTPIGIATLQSRSVNDLRNIFEYNGQLFVVVKTGNAGLIYRISLQTKQLIYNFGIPSSIPSYQSPSGGLTLSGSKIYGMTASGIYEYNPSTNVFTWKYNLPSSVGYDFKGELISGGNGKLYGISAGGGANNYGTLFEYDIASNTAVAKVNFSSSNGYNLLNVPILASNGNLYGSCANGGANSYGTLWEYNISTGVFTVKYNPTGSVGYIYNKLMQASDGKIYGNSGGNLFRYDYSNNNFVILKTSNEFTGSSSLQGPLVEENFTPPSAGTAVYTCNTTATLAPGSAIFNAGTSKWSVVSGVATIANIDSANATVNNLLGANTFRYTTNYGACISGYSDVIYNGKPINPTTTNGSRCGTGAGTVTLGATSSSSTGMVNWYAAATGGSILNSGNSFTTPSISTTTTYYAEVADSFNSRSITYSWSSLYGYGGCYSNNQLSKVFLLDKVNSTGIATNNSGDNWIKATFSAPITVNTITLSSNNTFGIPCFSSDLPNNLNGALLQYSNDDVNWTTSTTISGVLQTDFEIVVNVGSVNAKFWRIYKANGNGVATTEFRFNFTPNISVCNSDRVPVTAYINNTGAPTVTSTTNGSGCDSATLQAAASSGSINWYAAASGGSILKTGNSFTTPKLTANTTYYASAINGGCESARTPVTATINAPSITCAADVVVGNTANQCGATVTVPSPTISSPCGGAAPTLTNNFNGTANASGTYPVGTTTVVWTATGSNGNAATCTQLVTVNDIQSPNVVCQNKTVYLDASGNAGIAASQLNNGSTDNCGIATYDASKTSFNCSNTGANQVILTVTDVNGNSSACAAIVTVLDTIKPTITAPANISVNTTTGVCGTVVSFTATASDNCSVASITYSPASGSLFAIGTTIVTATATDNTGNSKSATFTVTVTDNQPPTITCPSNVTISCTSSTDTSNTGKATASDNCQVQSITYSDVSTKSNNNALCSYYSYTINRTWTATDINGRSSSCVQVITVVDNVKPVINAAGSNLDVGCNPTNAQIEAALGTATASDNCSPLGLPTVTDGAVVVNGILRSQTRSFNISDVCGNAAITVNKTAIWTVLAPASIGIASSANNVCAGTSVTFTATPTSGGATPAYQWTKNGTNITNATNSIYSYTPADGDIITCIMTATNACQTNVVVNSNTIAMLVKSNTSSITTVSICPASLPYVWNDNNYNTTGTYVVHLTNSQGCDSAATLNLTIKPVSTSTTTVSVCPASLPYVWNGNSYSSSGSYDFATTNAVGCDSIATLVLIVKSNTSSVTTLNICPASLPYEWNGNYYLAAGTYLVHLTNTQGCDSAATLNLNIKSNSGSTTTVSVCPTSLPYVWNDNSYTTTGNYVVHLTNSQGCDSAATLILTVKSNSSSTATVSICPASLPYLWNGNSYTSGGTYLVHLTNSNGCDSAATLNLTVQLNVSSTSAVSICPASLPYLWNGNNYTAAGIYEVHFNSSIGCDSTAILNLTVLQNTSSNQSVNICPQQFPYVWNGLTFTSPGTQTAHLTNAAGCDSAATLILTVGLTPSVTISTSSTTVCSSNDVTFTASSISPGPNPIYEWKVGINSVGSGSSITFPTGTLFNGDAISCVLTANNPCQTSATVNSNVIVMTVLHSPPIGVSTIQSPVMCKIGSTRYVYNSNTNEGGIWSSSNDNVATVSTINKGNGIVTAQGNGTATLTYTKTALSGCVVSASVNVIVDSVAAINPISGISGMCKGSSTTFTTATTGGIWSSLNNYATVNSSGLVTGKDAGAAMIIYRVSNINGCSEFASKQISINPIPNVPTISYAIGSINPQIGAGNVNSFCNGKTFTVVGTPAGGIWSSSNVSRLTVNSVNGLCHTIGLGAATLTYVYTNPQGCSNSRSIVGTVVACASRGINTNVLAVNDTKFTLYPNPARQLVSLNIKQFVGSGTIVITDLYGKQVKQQLVSMGINTIDISHLSKGVYFVSVISSSGKQTEKLVVE